MIDTNILISAALFPAGKTARTVFATADKYLLVISSQIIDELRTVVKRKFPGKVQETESLLRRLQYEIAYTPEYIDPDIFPKIRDQKDYPILASAILANVDVFISGDADFEDVMIEWPEILKPAEFADKYLSA
jgi:putative PIN family toxin of toxin-antitoxin system